MTALLDVRGLTVELLSEQRPVLSDISFSLQPGTITGLYGPSGSGKSTLALALLRLLDPHGYRVSGQILLNGRDVLQMAARELPAIRGSEISLVFQDPALALNPVLTIGHQISEAARAHGIQADVQELLATAGLPDPARIGRSYPHQLSGGERQRALIAQALASKPKLVIADEPFTALDAPRVLELAAVFGAIQARTGTAFLVVSHSPGVLARMASAVIVLSQGCLVDYGAPAEVFQHAGAL